MHSQPGDPRIAMQLPRWLVVVELALPGTVRYTPKITPTTAIAYISLIVISTFVLENYRNANDNFMSLLTTTSSIYMIHLIVHSYPLVTTTEDLLNC